MKCVRISGGHDVRGGLRALREIRLESPDLVYILASPLILFPLKQLKKSDGSDGEQFIYPVEKYCNFLK